MKTFYFLAVPQFKDCGKKPEVLYKVQGVMSKDNPLMEFCNFNQTGGSIGIKGISRCRKISQGKLLFISKKAKRISKAFYGAWGRYYFDHKINTLYDHVVLSDSDLVERYNYLLQEKESTGDADAFLKDCYDLSIRQKKLDIELWKNKADQVMCSFDNHSFTYLLSSPQSTLIDYFARKYFQKETEINLLRDRLGILEYPTFKDFTGRCTAEECHWFSIMRTAKLIKPVIHIAEQKDFEVDLYRVGRKAANSALDMSAERLSFLMQRGRICYRSGYDYYFACSGQCA